MWPFIGRGPMVASVADALRSGRGVTLTGDAGIGKTRLAHAALEQLADEGWTTWTFEAGPAGGAVPFLPFASLLRAPVTETLERLVDAAATLVGSGERVAALVDDVHALDDVSLAFVAHVIATTDVRLVLTVRTSDEATRLVRAWTDSLPRVGVEPLDRGAVDALVRATLGAAEPSATRWIWDTTQGNPLFVRELVTDAVEREALVERDGRWTLGAGSRPPGRRLRDVVVDRFGSLWDAEREAVELLAIAAPIGLRLFEKLATPEVVHGLEHRGLIVAERSGNRTNVRLAHRIQSEVIREHLGPSTVDYHRRRLLDATSSIGERRRSDRLRAAVWRMELGDTSDPEGLLAAAQELVTLVDGPSASVRRHRASDAGGATGPELLDRAARLARAALDGGVGVEAAVLLFSVLSRLGRHDEARTIRASLDDLVADEAERVVVSRALADIDVLVLGDPAGADAQLASLEETATAPELLRSIRATRGVTLLSIGQFTRALESATSVLDDPDANDAERVRAGTTAALGLAHGGRTEESLARLDAATQLAEASGQGRSAGAVFPRIVALANAGAYDELDGLIGIAHKVCEQHGLHDGVAIFAGAASSAALRRGRPRTALTWADTVAAHLGLAEPLGLRRLTHAVRAAASALLGDADVAADEVGVLDAMPSLKTFDVDVVRARAWARVAQGRTDAAIDLLVTEAEVCVERGAVADAIGHLHDVARFGRADLVAPRIGELVVGVDGRFLPTQAVHVAALVADDADALEAAAASFAEIGAALIAAETFAQAAAAHRRAGRADLAGAAAARSRDLQAECEGAMTPALEGAEPLLALTKREREVVQLAAEGMTDREIADQLIVSIRTVETHLHNAYAKLAVEGRDALSSALSTY